MTTQYRFDRFCYYGCLAARLDNTRQPGCRGISARTVDPVVEKAFLDAIGGKQIAVALAAAEEVTARHTRTHRAAELAVTRAAVWKAVEQLRELGVTLDAQTSKGYRLAAGVSALSPERIESLLGADLRAGNRVPVILASPARTSRLEFLHEKHLAASGSQEPA